VQAFDRPRGRHADGRHEQLGSIADGDFDELVELAMRVVVVRLAGRAANLGEREVYAEWEGWVGEVGFEVVDDLSGRVRFWARSQSTGEAQAHLL
jgi:hypothetical protein